MANKNTTAVEFEQVHKRELEYIQKRRSDLRDSEIPKAPWNISEIEEQDGASGEDSQDTEDGVSEKIKDHHTESGEIPRAIPAHALSDLHLKFNTARNEQNTVIDDTESESNPESEQNGKQETDSKMGLKQKAAEGPVGLAFSGGGIRSATFNLGVLQALAKMDVLKFFDYLSTVSGGGYIGSCLTSLLANPKAGVRVNPAEGKERKKYKDFPFQYLREQEEGDERLEVKWLRKHGKFLASSTSIFSSGIWRMIATYLSGLVLTNINTAWLVILIGGLIHWMHVGHLCLHDYFKASENILEIIHSVLILGPFVVVLLLRSIGAVRPGLKLDGRRRLSKWYTRFMWIGSLICLIAGLVLLAGHIEWAWWQIGSILNSITAASSMGLILGLWKNKRLAGTLFKLSWVVLLPVLVAQFLNWAWTSGFFDGWSWLIWAGGLFVFGTFLNTNRINNHHFYRDRLSEAFIIRRKNNEIWSNEALCLKDLHEAGNGAPYHLINATLNVPSSTNRYLKGRGADFFLFSKEYCGADATGYRETAEYDKGKTRLATAMAIAGAAASPDMGTDTNPILRFLMTLFNVRLNRWMPNPANPNWHKVTIWPWYFIKELLGFEKESDSRLNLSDGGHHENLGLYTLLKRGCVFIVASDVGADPKFQFEDLANVMRKARIDMGIDIKIELDDLRPIGDQRETKAHFVTGKIFYPTGVIGTLVYIKSTVTGKEPEDLLGYRRQNPSFPDQSTGDQFFDEGQFESYRKLGEISAREAFET